MTVALVIKFIHVLLAIVALGANATYGVWLSLAMRSPDHLRFALRGIRFLDNRIANPAYILLFVTGAAMVLLTGMSWETPWLATAILLYIATVAVSMRGYSPALRRQIAALETSGAGSDAYRAAAATALRMGLIVMGFVLAILFLMVTKPALWD